MEDYKEKYEQALARAREIHRNEDGKVSDMEWLFPELKESKDEEIRNAICIALSLDKAKDYLKSWDITYEDAIAWLEKQKDNYIKKDIDDAYLRGIADAKSELEKQKPTNSTDLAFNPVWRKNSPDNKPQKKHSVLMMTTHGVAEGEWLGDEWFQYRWSCKLKETEVLYWMNMYDGLVIKEE